MDSEPETEACGRCSMSSVVEMTAEEGGSARDPFADGTIEVTDGEARAASRHVVALGRLKNRLDEWASAVTYGR